MKKSELIEEQIIFIDRMFIGCYLNIPISELIPNPKTPYLGRYMHWDDDRCARLNNDEYITKIREWLFK